MKLKLDRIISIATLLASVAAILLVLKRPATVTPTQAPATAISHAADSEPRSTEAEPATQRATPSAWSQSSSPATSQSAPAVAQVPQASAPVSSGAKPDANSSSDAVSGMIAKMLGGGGGGGTGLSLDSNVGGGSPNIKDQQVTMDGDVVHGKFLTEIAGKDVWVTISGHMGEKDGYATFDPTEIKVGDMNVPVSLVNPALQRKLAEERDRLKIPNSPTQ